MDEDMWRGWVGQLQVPGQGSREKGMWNFPKWGREVRGLVLERMEKRSGVRAGLVGAALQPAALGFSPWQDTQSPSPT